jgi:hypothetical protein
VIITYALKKRQPIAPRGALAHRALILGVHAANHHTTTAVPIRKTQDPSLWPGHIPSGRQDHVTHWLYAAARGGALTKTGGAASGIFNNLRQERGQP